MICFLFSLRDSYNKGTHFNLLLEIMMTVLQWENIIFIQLHYTITKLVQY